MSLFIDLVSPDFARVAQADATELFEDLGKSDNREYQLGLVLDWLRHQGIDEDDAQEYDVEALLDTILKHEAPDIDEVEENFILDLILASEYPGIPNDFRSWAIEEKRRWVAAVEQIIGLQIYYRRSWNGDDPETLGDLIALGTGDEDEGRKTRNLIARYSMMAKAQSRA